MRWLDVLWFFGVISAVAFIIFGPKLDAATAEKRRALFDDPSVFIRLYLAWPKTYRGRGSVLLVMWGLITLSAYVVAHG